MSQPGLQLFPSVDQAALLAARDAAERLVASLTSLQLAVHGLLFFPKSTAQVWQQLPAWLECEMRINDSIAAKNTAEKVIDSKVLRAYELSAADSLDVLNFNGETHMSGCTAILGAAALATEFHVLFEGAWGDPDLLEFCVEHANSDYRLRTFSQLPIDAIRPRILQEWAAASRRMPAPSPADDDAPAQTSMVDVTKSGGAKPTWEHVCDWVGSRLEDTHRERLKAYAAQFPDRDLPTLKDLRSALSYRKRTRQGAEY